MKKNLLIALIAAASIAPVAAHAQAYLGGTVGYAHQKATIEDIGSVKDHDVSGSVFGGYQITKNFGAEVGYVWLNKLRPTADDVTFTIEPQVTYLAATGSFPLNDKFALTAKVGVASTSTRFSAAGEVSEKTRQTSPVLGFGVSYAITPEVVAIAQYENFGKVVKEDGGHLKAQNIGFGLRVSF
ncbi:outer membrane beta-barrel protein [Massilia sp. CF038]|uniref:outer membrane beta-barrel protein n=1 Tax=Massilia sp. CF038 TaxID=1881045 RepID=UPI00090F8A7A|nr:outer membrane beta-barrel protein [Massilia sp. CF038]SHH20719.1 Opacity protein [Massilia sp. CF038]